MCVQSMCNAMGQMLRACFEGDLVRLIEVTRVAAGCANRLVAFFWSG